jgi:CO/xanthine dehydrogenase FAD-binding subunit
VIQLVNTRILAHEFDFVVPKSIPEVLDLLRRYGSRAKLMAGGTDLLIQMKMEKVTPEVIIHVAGIAELDYVRHDRGLRIGATTKLSTIRRYCEKGTRYSALYEAISSLGKPQVWNMGTMAGNLCTASPAADTAPPLLVYNGRVKLLSGSGERTLGLEEFFTGVNRTALAEGELLVEIQADEMSGRTGSAFMKMARVGADISKVTCSVALERDGTRCLSCRIAFGAVAPVPMRAKAAEDLVRGAEVDGALVEKAGNRAAQEIRPIDDVRSTAEYRRDAAKALFKEVFSKAWARAGGEEA